MRQTDARDYKPGERVNTLWRGCGVVLATNSDRYVKVLPDDTRYPGDITVCIASHGELEKI